MTYLKGIVLILLPTVALASDPLDRPEAFSRFGDMLGAWEGSCIASFTNEGPEIRGTSLMTVTTILDGHFIQKDMRLDVQDQHVPPSLNRAIYVYDRQAKSFVGFAFNNMGTTGHHTLYWTPNGKVITAQTIRERHGPATSTSVAEYGKDRTESKVRRSIAGGPFFLFATTSHRRIEKSLLDSEIETGPAAIPPAEAVLHRLAGTWRLTGKMSPFPDAPTSAIVAELEVKSILGGHATMWTVQSEPAPGSATAYRSVSYVTWDKEGNCYRRLMLTNSGDWHFSKGCLLGERTIVYAGTTFRDGVPIALRTVYTWSEDASTANLTCDGYAGDGPPASYQDVKIVRIGKTR